MSLEFSSRQQVVITRAITLISAVALAAVVVWLFVLAIRFFTFFSGVFMPLAVAGIFALMLKPYYGWWLKVCRSEGAAAGLVLMSLLVPVGALLWFFGSLLAAQVNGLIESIPDWLEAMTGWMKERQPKVMELWERYELGERAEGLLGMGSGWIASSVAGVESTLASMGSAVFRAVTGLLGWVVLPVYFIFLLMIPSVPAARFDEALPFLKRETREDVVYLVKEFVGIMVAFFRGQFVIAFLQGLLYGVGFAVAGLRYGFILGLIFGLLNIVPYLGNILGLLIVLPLAYFQVGGGMELLFWTLVVFGVTQVIESYVLTPRIMGQQTGLNPGVIIFAMFFWGSALGGILGMILAIPLTAFLVVLWRLLRQKYVTEWV
ncbi:MAG TPA: AI-2E family transporter [Kiritimatiellia bacterium]|nr:AI-2E family transporter [Kiritimatiellia bacterium]